MGCVGAKLVNHMVLIEKGDRATVSISLFVDPVGGHPVIEGVGTSSHPLLSFVHGTAQLTEGAIESYPSAFDPNTSKQRKPAGEGQTGKSGGAREAMKCP